MPKAIISFSGGLGSAISALAAMRYKLDYELVFVDTLIEDEDLYRFMKAVAAVCCKPIHWLIDGRTPWQVFIDDGKVGNSRNANCSRILKTEQVQCWLEHNAAADDYLVLGMDMSEQDRLDRAQEKWWPRQVVSLLKNYKITRPMYAGILAHYGLKQPRLYDMGFPHNNCGGFCVRTGQTQMATLLKLMPKRYKEHEDAELAAHSQIPGKRYPFLRRYENNTTIYMTLQEFRHGIESGALSVPMYDFGGCGCFVDDEDKDGPAQS